MSGLAVERAERGNHLGTQLRLALPGEGKHWACWAAVKSEQVGAGLSHTDCGLHLLLLLLLLLLLSISRTASATPQRARIRPRLIKFSLSKFRAHFQNPCCVTFL